MYYTIQKERINYIILQEMKYIKERQVMKQVEAEHMSDRLHITALLVRKPRYNRNNSQSDLSD